MSSRPVRTLIVSDRDLIFHGLVALLAAHGDQVELLDRRHGLDADVHVIVLDAVSYGGPQLFVPTSPAGPRPAVVVLAPHVHRVPGGRGRAAPTGSEGVVFLTVTSEELVSKIRAAALTPEDDRSVGALDGRLLLLHRGGGLSAREVEVIGLIALGLSNQEISARLYLSINSVKTYVRTAYRKMGVGTRSQAVGWALSRGFPTRSAEDDALTSANT
ncbi:DNA-binding response regulator [Nocardioides psychrotolerans]|uniref:DNA-binding response regulator, NarL/FixJ family, contains REC and HTH domains n=1 Tax=Nocardioides psychrotolerans TaxID=1005945 RepID=A0A1I3QVG9_9ACTN|nr:response regulator transcription factor [Nocardioides psychrotolerans]GEP40286.1 DNA-binding response regulator [Nocardioides psychrotolerans]SFJ37895.1 DNA-binding response regulator, NarL/FixJ family, contains REC and HTH domains [Nocardioides psychrotolerans]